MGTIEVWMLLDNYPPHRSVASEYEHKYQGRLHFIFFPPYSPKLNPKENMWAWPRDYCARDSIYAVDKEPPQRIHEFSFTPTRHLPK
jgi:hypothetical protein